MRLHTALVPLFVLCSCVHAFTPGSTNWIPQSFFFDWTPADAPLPIPTAAQCEVLKIKWTRPAGLKAPDPVAPYFLQIYASTFTTPFVIPAGEGVSFDWTVPFNPGTRFMICMFDSGGTTGGCQDIYTVYPSLTGTTVCTNLTYPPERLGVTSLYNEGTLSQFGWPDQCTDIQVTPTSGIPPYTFTVAPALHPPVNFTSNSMSPQNWTVSLSWASPFFISVVDSQGISWSNGPLHAGGNGPTDCLSYTDSQPTTVSLSATIGSVVGAAILGAALALVGAWIWSRRRNPGARIDPYATPFDLNSIPVVGGRRPGTSYRQLSSDTHDHSPHADYADPFHRGAPSSPPLTRRTTRGSMPLQGLSNPQGTRTPGLDSQYEIEPFDLSASESGYSHSLTRTLSPPPRPVQGGSRPEPIPRQTVYVVHHDSGRAPVTVLSPEGTEVLELPPSYVAAGRSGEANGSSRPPRRAVQDRDRKASLTHG